MNTKFFRGALSIVLAAILAIGIVGSLGMSAPSTGVVSHRYQTLYAGATPYTAQITSTGVDAGLFGAMQVQAVHGSPYATETMTVTTQFSNQPVACTAATLWTNATEFIVGPSGYSTTAPITLTTFQVAETITIAGNGGDVIREIPVRGRCVRVLAQSSASTYTPTIYLRLLNRQ